MAGYTSTPVRRIVWASTRSLLLTMLFTLQGRPLYLNQLIREIHGQHFPTLSRIFLPSILLMIIKALLLGGATIQAGTSAIIMDQCIVLKMVAIPGMVPPIYGERELYWRLAFQPIMLAMQ